MSTEHDAVGRIVCRRYLCPMCEARLAAGMKIISKGAKAFLEAVRDHEGMMCAASLEMRDIATEALSAPPTQPTGEVRGREVWGHFRNGVLQENHNDNLAVYASEKAANQERWDGQTEVRKLLLVPPAPAGSPTDTELLNFLSEKICREYAITFHRESPASTRLFIGGPEVAVGTSIRDCLRAALAKSSAPDAKGVEGGE